MGSRRFAVITAMFAFIVAFAIAIPASAAQAPADGAWSSPQPVYAGHVGHDHPWLGADGQPVPFDSDEEVLDFLRTADVVSTESIPTGVTKPKKLLLERNGVRMHAVFRNVDLTKRRVRLDDGQYYMRLRDYGLFEVAAYRLARMLGYDNVPPAVVRRVGGTRGSLQLWVEQTMPESSRREKGARPPDYTVWLRQTQDMYLFDYLITNIDRHPGNYLMGRTGKLWMIDHTRAFQTYVDGWTPDGNWFVNRQLWQRLQALDQETLQASLGDVLTKVEIEVLLERVDEFMAHIRGQIAERGETEVITS